MAKGKIIIHLIKLLLAWTFPVLMVMAFTCMKLIDKLHFASSGKKTTPLRQANWSK
jgi:hypothetical protein